MKNKIFNQIKKLMHEMYFTIEEDEDRFIFNLKKGIPFSTSYLIFKHAKTGKRISKEIKNSKAVITLDELNEMDEDGTFNIFTKVKVNFIKNIFIQRIRFVFENNSNKFIYDKNNRKILESVQSNNYYLNFIYKSADFVATATELKKEDNHIILKGEIETYDEIDFNNIEIMIALTSLRKYIPCNYEKNGTKIKFDANIYFDVNEEDIGNKHYIRLRLKDDDFVIDSNRIKAKYLSEFNKIEDKYLDYIENFKPRESEEDSAIEGEIKDADSINQSEYCSMAYLGNDSNLTFLILNKNNIQKMINNEKRILKHFSDLEKKKFVFLESFHGKSYSGQPKYIYEKLLELGYDKYLDFIWSYAGDMEIPGEPIITDRDERDYEKLLGDSHYWISNISFPILKENEKTVYLQTTHGTPYKLMGEDIETNSKKINKGRVLIESETWNYLLSPNDFSKEIFKRAFKYDGTIINKGYPANDIFYQNNEKKIEKIRNDLNLPKDKKIILYAPTYRDYELSAEKQNPNLLLDFASLYENLSEDYVLIVRLHYLVSKDLEIEDGMKDFIIDLSDYNDVADLYLISDILITDYSSVFFDFAHSKKPILFFVPDIETYTEFRGLYSEVRENLPGPEIFTNDELADKIRNIDKVSEEFKAKYETFYDKFCNLGHGDSAEEVIDIVFKDVKK